MPLVDTVTALLYWEVTTAVMDTVPPPLASDSVTLEALLSQAVAKTPSAKAEAKTGVQIARTMWEWVVIGNLGCTRGV